MNEETIKGLESLGFTNYESRVFCALFEGHTMNGSDVAIAAKIPRSSAYDILKLFTQKGFCNEIQTSSVVLYELIDPKVVEDKFEKEIKDTYHTRLGLLKDSFEKLQPLFKSKVKKDEKADVELIKGFNKHRELKFLNLLKETKKELLLMNRLEGRIFKEQDEASLDFYKRGGTVRSIYEASYNFKIQVEDTWKDVSPEGLIDICENFIQAGEQIKLTNKIHQNMFIFDRKVVFVSLVNPDMPAHTRRTDIYVNNENYANAMVDYFESFGGQAETIEQFKNKLKSN